MNISNYILLIVLICFISCSNERNKRVEQESGVDLIEIRERGVLYAVTSFNSTNYFIYRGRPMGYQYELLQELSNHLNLKLEIITENDLNESFNKLASSKVDLIAMNLTVTTERKELISFTKPYAQTRQILVQRKPDDYRQLSKQEIDLSIIRNQLDLAGKTIYVQKNSSHYERLKNLSDEIGDSIRIISVPEESEQLISMVAAGEIDYTICDEIVAKVNQRYYPNIDIQTSISFPQYLAWAVRKDSEELLFEINKWVEEYTKTYKYAYTYAKYFENSKSQMIHSDYFAISSGRISPYDKVIKKFSKEIGWDWRLVAALMYQESNFNPNAKSWAGAFGLMQLMPYTARELGVDSTSSEEEQIWAGMRFLRNLDAELKPEIKDDEERIKFILASYNAGRGHVIDAIRLAEKYNKDPQIWDNNVDYFVLNKSNPKYYRDPVSIHGYCYGQEPYNYVSQIMERYEHYKNIIEE